MSKQNYCGVEDTLDCIYDEIRQAMSACGGKDKELEKVCLDLAIKYAEQLALKLKEIKAKHPLNNDESNTNYKFVTDSEIVD